jgi:hypothetical protein
MNKVELVFRFCPVGAILTDTTYAVLFFYLCVFFSGGAKKMHGKWKAPERAPQAMNSIQALTA